MFCLEVVRRSEQARERRECSPSVFRLYCRSTFRLQWNTADAEDAVQEVVLAAWKHLHQFKNRRRRLQCTDDELFRSLHNVALKSLVTRNAPDCDWILARIVRAATTLCIDKRVSLVTVNRSFDPTTAKVELSEL